MERRIRCLRTGTGVETDHLWAEAFSPAGDVLATANDDDTVQLWDCTTGRHLRTFADHSGRVRSIAFSPTARCLRPAATTASSACGTSRRAAAWPRWPANTDRVYLGRVQPGRRTARYSEATTDRNGHSDVASATHIRTLARHEGRLWSAAFNSDGTIVATAGDYLTIRLWDLADRHGIAHLHRSYPAYMVGCFQPGRHAGKRRGRRHDPAVGHRGRRVLPAAADVASACPRAGRRWPPMAGTSRRGMWPDSSGWSSECAGLTLVSWIPTCPQFAGCRLTRSSDQPKAIHRAPQNVPRPAATSTVSQACADWEVTQPLVPGS